MMPRPGGTEQMGGAWMPPGAPPEPPPSLPACKQPAQFLAPSASISIWISWLVKVGASSTSAKAASAGTEATAAASAAASAAGAVVAGPPQRVACAVLLPGLFWLLSAAMWRERPPLPRRGMSRLPGPLLPLPPPLPLESVSDVGAPAPAIPGRSALRLLLRVARRLASGGSGGRGRELGLEGGLQTGPPGALSAAAAAASAPSSLLARACSPLDSRRPSLEGEVVRVRQWEGLPAGGGSRANSTSNDEAAKPRAALWPARSTHRSKWSGPRLPLALLVRLAARVSTRPRPPLPARAAPLPARSMPLPAP